MALSNPSKESYGLKRIISKNTRNAIVQRLAADFNLTPIIAEAFYEQFSRYYEAHTNISLSSGEVAYEAIAATSRQVNTFASPRKLRCACV